MTITLKQALESIDFIHYSEFSRWGEDAFVTGVCGGDLPVGVYQAVVCNSGLLQLTKIQPRESRPCASFYDEKVIVLYSRLEEHHGQEERRVVDREAEMKRFMGR